MQKNIQIKELSREETKKLSEALVDFNPEKCLSFGNKKGIVQRFFLVNVSVKSNKVHRKVKKILRDKYALSYYGYWDGNEKVITNGKCPQCDGEKMWWDY